MNKLLTLTVGLVSVLMTSCSNDKTQIPNNFKQDREKFVTTIELFQESNKISSELPNLLESEQSSQEQKMTKLIKQGIETSEGISDEFLNYLHPDLNDNFRNKLVKSNELYLDGFTSQLNDPSSSLKKQLSANQLLSEWATYWDKNFDHINKNLSTEKTKKSYWRMLLRLFIADFISILVFSFFVIALLSPVAAIGLLAEKMSSGLATIISLISLPFIIIAGIGQAYFWTLWAAFCAFTVVYYIDSPTVTHNWLYYLTGFSFVTGPIGWLSYKESRLAKSHEEQKKIERGTFYYSLIAIIGYVVFCIWPNLMDYKYISWASDWLY